MSMEYYSLNSNILHSFERNLLNINKKALKGTCDDNTVYKKTRRSRKTGRRHTSYTRRVREGLGKVWHDGFTKCSMSSDVCPTVTLFCICCAREIRDIDLIDLPNSSKRFYNCSNSVKMCSRCSRLFPPPQEWPESESIKAMKASTSQQAYYEELSIRSFELDETTYSDPAENTLSDLHKLTNQSLYRDETFSASDTDRSSSTDSICSPDLNNSEEAYSDASLSFEDLVLQEFEKDYSDHQYLKLINKSKDTLISDINSLRQKISCLENGTKLQRINDELNYQSLTAMQQSSF